MAGDQAVTRAHRFNPTILRSYDIRGQVGKTLSVRDAFFIGAAFRANDGDEKFRIKAS